VALEKQPQPEIRVVAVKENDHVGTFNKLLFVTTSLQILLMKNFIFWDITTRSPKEPA
jgi:hypothetical protein